ncbi:MAG: OmpA family protein [Akkermansia sp.]|nr:OmpA family protein [Akkermansia sp.]MBR2314428.1 OmpA family protein [Akkermansia sp.]
MKRNILLFLCAFLATLGVCAGVFMLLKHKADKQADEAAAQPGITTTPEPPAPTPAPEPSEIPVDEPAPAPQPEPAPAPEPAPSPEPAPEVQPEPEPAPAPEPPAKAPELREKPRNAEHKAALTAVAAVESEEPAAALERLVKEGAITQEAAEMLAAWATRHKIKAVEEVGNSRRPNGDRVTRYRIVAEDGSDDLLIDVVSQKGGKVFIESAKTSSSDKTKLDPAADSLTVAEGFVEAVRLGNMAVARTMITGSEVSDATVAGLCMIFEEGEFKLREQAPIRNTFTTEKNAGYLVYVLSPVSTRPANIGMELTRLENDTWRIKAVAMDALLSSYESIATEEGGHYFPIVKNPKGGDSLALFFGFNESVLTPRSMRQLQIVAELLKASKGVLQISGHTDDVGSEKYNLELSIRRANAVKEALVSFGVDASQISTEGMGKSQPRRFYTTEDTTEQIDYIRGENRRAEIYLDFES